MPPVSLPELLRLIAHRWMVAPPNDAKPPVPTPALLDVISQSVSVIGPLKAAPPLYPAGRVARNDCPRDRTAGLRIDATGVEVRHVV